MHKPIAIFFMLLAILLSATARATPLLFTLDSTALAGSRGVLAFDLIGSAGNTVHIAGSFIDTTLDTKNQFFNESLADIQLGSIISFVVDASAIAGTPFPDALSLFLLDPSSGMPMAATSDPSGSDALFRLDLGGDLHLFTSGLVSLQAVPLQEIPAPPSLLLVLPLLPMALRFSRRTLAAVLILASFNVMAQMTEDVSSQLSISRSGFVLNRTTNTFDTIVTLSNTGPSTIAAPLWLTVRDLSTPEAALYNPGGFDAKDYPQALAALDMGVLPPGGQVNTVLKFINPRQLPINFTLGASATILNDSNSVMLTVRAWKYSGNESMPQGAPAGQGVQILAGGVVRGVTGSDSQASFTVPLWADSLSARRAPTSTGVAVLDLRPSVPAMADVVLDDDGEVYGEATLRIDQLRQQLLPSTFGALTLRFLASGERTVKLSYLARVQLYDALQRPVANLTSMFALRADGSLQALQPAALANVLGAWPGQLTLAVMALDTQQNAYSGRVALHIVRHTVSGRLVAPPSNPGLRLDGIRVVGKMLNTGIIVSTVSDADGSFTLPMLPNGNLSLAAETLQSKRFYYGSGVFSLTAPVALLLPLNSAADGAGAPLKLIQAGDDARMPPGPAETAARLAVHQATPRKPLQPFGAGMKTSAASATVAVLAGAQNVPSTQSATLQLKRGTARVLLSYLVASAEYPDYVTAQSIYNDVWGIKVFGGAQGVQLFDLTRQVNSQLALEPVWQPDGTTGTIELSLDVKALASTADTELTLTAFATNIGDALLPTGVSATLVPEERFTIDKISPVPTAWIAKNDGSYFSIPASGARNVFQRKVWLDITSPDDAVITKLKAELLEAGNDVTVLDSAPGPDLAVVDSGTLAGTTTFSAEASTVNGVPPPASNISYRYTLKARSASGDELSDVKTDAGKHALWRMPAGFSRYSIREPGHDDWCSRRTYEWMVQNATLLRAINDISGEHGKDIGHDTHARGSDIDMYHFYRFPGADASNGTSNYLQLLARIYDLPKQNSSHPAEQAAGLAAVAQITAWINASRAGIDALAANPNVLEVGYILGGPGTTGISGTNWGERLLTTGKVRYNNVDYTLVDATWNNLKYQPWPGHHHHVHVTLNTAD